jgi:hypothetical protein
LISRAAGARVMAEPTRICKLPSDDNGLSHPPLEGEGRARSARGGAIGVTRVEAVQSSPPPARFRSRAPPPGGGEVIASRQRMFILPQPRGGEGV